MDAIINQLVAIALLSLRIAPTLAFAPPFTLIRIPALVRMSLAIGVAAWMAASNAAATWDSDYWVQGLPITAAAELFLGMSLALALQLAFAMIAMMGRAIDIQAGFGLALLVDPTTRAQAPLIGTILSYGAAAVFFMTDGPGDVMALFSISLDHIPLGMTGLPDRLGPLFGYLSIVSVMALGLVGLLLLAMLLIDLTVALLSKTLPQMNVLLLGFQVKAMATLLLLPATMGLAVSGFARLMRLAIDSPLLLLG